MVLKGLSVSFKPAEYVSDLNILRASSGKECFRDGPVINQKNYVKHRKTIPEYPSCLACPENNDLQ